MKGERRVLASSITKLSAALLLSAFAATSLVRAAELTPHENTLAAAAKK
jgi:hypothetical protein